MTNHTPFPWKKGKYSETNITGGDKNRLVANTGGYQSNFEDYLPENIANANLILKVSDMYEFIDMIANVFKWDNSTVEIWAEEAKEILKGIEDG